MLSVNDSGLRRAPPAVLVVDDEILIRMMVADYLRECGYEVIEAGSGDEAVEVLVAAELEIDLVFSDVQMPGKVDGFGLARWVRRERPHIRIVLTSGVARAGDCVDGFCGDGPFMEKPYSVAEVERSLRQLLAN